MALITLLILMNVVVSIYSIPPEEEESPVSPGKIDVINDKLKVGGMPLFQGDIVMDELMLLQILADEMVSRREKTKLRRMWRAAGHTLSRRHRRAAVNKYRLWGNGELQHFGENSEKSYGVIPYVMEADTPAWRRDMVSDAMNHWEEKARIPGSPHYCVKFVPRKKESVYLSFVHNDGCWSKVGKGVPSGPQTISLGAGCGNMGLVAHEIGHALGFFHEQSRPDRDDYIKIHTENMKTSRSHNFVKYDDRIVDTRNVPYDYASLMHYTLDAFSWNGLDTMEPIQEVPDGTVIGQRGGVSDSDVEQVRRMYGCVPYVKEEEIVTTQPPTQPPKFVWLWDYKKGVWYQGTPP